MRQVLLFCSLFLFLQLRARVGVELGLYGEAFYKPYTPFVGGQPKLLLPAGGALYIQLGKLVTLDYRFGAANYGARYGYVHAPAGFASGIYLSQEQKSPAGLLLALIPEGFGFYLREDHKGFHIAFDVLGVDYYHERNGFRDTYNTCTSVLLRYRYTGTRGDFFALSPYAGVTVLPGATDHRTAFRAGIVFSVEPRKPENKNPGSGMLPGSLKKIFSVI